MHDKDEVPDPQMKIAVFASLPPQEAALLAGLLEVGGIRAVVSTGHGAPGPWTAWVGPGGLGLPATPLGRGRPRCSSMSVTSRRPVESPPRT